VRAGERQDALYGRQAEGQGQAELSEFGNHGAQFAATSGAVG
jgi:hypothetical protein